MFNDLSKKFSNNNLLEINKLLDNGKKRSEFDVSNELFNNPYKGFTSFNHFNGEPLFTDTFGTDGWKKERYPVYDFVEQEGNKTGCYPPCTIAYIRMLWRDIEPEEGKYNFELIDGILDKCKKHGQTLMFRIMQHTTRSFEDIPDWLAARIEHPERPDELRIKASPTADEYYITFGRMIKALGEKYDGNPLIYGVDISLSGAWGEGEGYEKVKPEILKSLIDSYTKSFKKTHLFGQIAAPELVNYACKTRHIGYRADGFGNTYHMLNYFPTRIYEMKELWEKAPITFEAFWYISEWQRKGWDIDYLIEQSLKWHISSFNGKSSTIPFEWYHKIQEWIKKMGYRFAIRSFEFPEQIISGEKANFKMWIENRGVAPIYNKLPVRIKLAGEQSYIIDTNLDICKWMPGDTIENFEIAIPKDILKGKYRIELSIGGFDNYPLVYLATETENKDGWYYLGEMEIN